MQAEGRRFCAGLLTFAETIGQHGKNRPVYLDDHRSGSELFRSALSEALSNYECRDEHFFSLFQVL